MKYEQIYHFRKISNRMLDDSSHSRFLAKTWGGVTVLAIPTKSGIKWTAKKCRSNEVYSKKIGISECRKNMERGLYIVTQDIPFDSSFDFAAHIAQEVRRFGETNGLMTIKGHFVES